MLAYDRAAHRPGRPTSRLEADEVEVEPVIELAPMLAAVNAARCDAAESAHSTHPTRPGPPVWRPCAGMAPTGTQSARDDVLRTLVLRDCACDGDGHRTAARGARRGSCKVARSSRQGRSALLVGQERRRARGGASGGRMSALLGRPRARLQVARFGGADKGLKQARKISNPSSIPAPGTPSTPSTPSIVTFLNDDHTI